MAAATVEQTIRGLVEDFEFLGEWEERYRYLIELGRGLEPLDAAERNDETRVEGCLSQVWMVSERKPDGTIHLRAASDAAIVSGLIAILLRIYSGRTPQEILAVDIGDVFRELGLDNHLIANRRNGFFSMVRRIKLEAAKLAA